MSLTGGAAIFFLAPCALAAPSEERPKPAASDDTPVPARVRLALSESAAAFLTEGRVRRLIDLELPSSIPLAAEPTGPIDENAVHVYIDLPSPGLVTIQVQSPQRKLETRPVNIAGLAWDVAARITAIATSETVLAQIAPVRKRPQRPREPTAAEIDAALRRLPSVAVGGSGWGVFLPRLHGGLGGSRVAVQFHQPFLSEELSLSALGGDGQRGHMRWLELGIGASHRVWLAPSVRMSFGGLAGLANLHVVKADPRSASSVAPEASFTVRAAAKIGIEGRLAPTVWMSFDVEPGIVLVDTPTLAQGAWLGAGLGLWFDQPLTVAAPKPE